jgi:thiol-disulfide isomerase/thioredoxin
MRTVALAALLTLAIPAWAIPPVPRPSKEFTFVAPNGQQVLLTSLKGKVVIIQFLYTWCQHCQAFSQELTKLQAEPGLKGIEFRGVAFDDNVQPLMATSYAQKFNVTFPVGYASRDTVISYLGLSVMERLAVPQVVIIDKKGVIRAQSQPLGSPELQNETNLRKMLTEMAAEGSAKAPAKAAPSSSAPAIPTPAKKSE